MSRIQSLDLLRGIAALSVAWFHFTNGNEHFLSPGLLRKSGEYGWLGVNIFFVISGFIIPYALARSDYRVRDYGRFLLKRIVRLDPPYVAAILLIVALGYLTSHMRGFRGARFHVSAMQLLVHLGYANVFLGYQWLSPVFWTLAIEAQYYLLVGLVFPLINAASYVTRWSTLAVAAGCALLISSRPLLFHWLFLFMLGMVTFQLKKRLITPAAYGVAVVLLATGAAHNDGLLVGAAGVLTALTIVSFHCQVSGLWAFLGQISYSLYLIHVPIGGRIINLGERLPDTSLTRSLTLAVALLLTLFVAWLFYRLVEQPAQCWSAKITYPKRVVAPSGFAPRKTIEPND